jgi:hypothetical protein
VGEKPVEPDHDPENQQGLEGSEEADRLERPEEQNEERREEHERQGEAPLPDLPQAHTQDRSQEQTHPKGVSGDPREKEGEDPGQKASAILDKEAEIGDRISTHLAQG